MPGDDRRRLGPYRASTLCRPVLDQRMLSPARRLGSRLGERVVMTDLLGCRPAGFEAPSTTYQRVRW
jgi:hypothetical protein